MSYPIYLAKTLDDGTQAHMEMHSHDNDNVQVTMAEDGIIKSTITVSLEEAIHIELFAEDDGYTRTA